jgi:hypothetical protein
VGEIERCLGIGFEREETGREASNDQDDDDEGDTVSTLAQPIRDAEKDCRPSDIELLFDAKRPQVQKWHELSGRVEVTCVAVKVEVRNAKRCERCAPRRVRVVAGKRNATPTAHTTIALTTLE